MHLSTIIQITLKGMGIMYYYYLQVCGEVTVTPYIGFITDNSIRNVLYNTLLDLLPNLLLLQHVHRVHAHHVHFVYFFSSF